MAIRRLKWNLPLFALTTTSALKATGADEQRTATAGSFLRTLTGPEVSVGLGVSIVLAVLANRIATPELVDSQARTDILGVISGGGLITNGVYLLVSPCLGFFSRTLYTAIGAGMMYSSRQVSIGHPFL